MCFKLKIRTNPDKLCSNSEEQYGSRTSRENSLELIELLSKIKLVYFKFPLVVTLDQ
jgi:hypothetical protein